MRKMSQFKLNNLTSVVVQLLSILAGLILPRLILTAFGSGANGLVSSISQFLSYITLMEAGVGSVARAAMFKPLANQDTKTLSAVVNTTERFFRSIAYVFLGYLLLLAVFYPFLAAKDGFDYGFVVTLVLILGIGTVAQYFFGLTYQLLLQADQKLYVSNVLQIVSILLNLAVCVVLILLGASLHIVKLLGAVVLLIRPIGIYLYVKRKYALDKQIRGNKDTLKQRWDGLTHHLAFFVHKNTDIAVLTFFTPYTEVSVYAICSMVVSNIQGLISLFSTSFTAKFGEIYAKNDRERLDKIFGRYETFIFLISTIMFAITAIMIVPFLRVYTAGVEDANYNRPLFAALLVLSEFLYVLRTPYSNLAFGAGEFKNTKKGAVIEMVCNLTLSLALVKWLGIVGVAIGTVVAMAYRTVDYAVFLSRNVLKRPLKYFIKNTALALLGYGLSAVVCLLLAPQGFRITGVMQWVMCAVVVAIICALINCGVQILFNKKAFMHALKVFED